LASGNGPGTVQLWNVGDPAHPSTLGQPLAAPTGFVNSVAFSPDGRTLAAGSGQTDATGHGAIQLWNVTNPAHPIALGKALITPGYGVNSVAFSPDGHTLASASGRGTVQLWNVADPAHPTALGQALTGATHGVFSVAFSPNGHILAGGTGGPSSGQILLWDVTNPARPHPVGPALSGPTTFINAVAFSPDGHTLAGASGQPTLTPGAIQLWNVTDPAKPTVIGQPLNDNGSSVGAVAFSTDGRILAAGDGDLACIDLWTLS
jgi:WD40 repeat protein